MDSIRLNNMIFQCHIGQHEAEREYLQSITITVDLYLNLERAGHTNNIADTIDYTQVYERIKQAVEAGEYCLLEGLVDDIAHTLLQTFRLQKVRIIATKRPADLVKKNVESVTVDIVREQKNPITNDGNQD